MKVPLCSTRLRPLWGRCPKNGKGERGKNGMIERQKEKERKQDKLGDAKGEELDSKEKINVNG